VPEPIAAGARKAGGITVARAGYRFALGAGVFLYYPGYRQMMTEAASLIDHVKSRSDAANKNPNSSESDGDTSGKICADIGQRGFR